MAELQLRLSQTASPPTNGKANKKNKRNNVPAKRGMVGAEGFEPSTFCSRSKRATRLRYAPTMGVALSKKCLLGEKQNSVKYIISGHHSQGTKTNISTKRLPAKHGKPFAL